MNNNGKNIAPIGIFDSGFGGLTVLKEIVQTLPNYDFIYLGDNARTPYGTRSFNVVYQFTLEGVKKLFEMGCHLVILACNTASAKALRNIQQKYLPFNEPHRRVLGVIRPTTEIVGHHTRSKHVGILGTTGTVQSQSYIIEIQNSFPDLTVFQQACPLWVPLIENNEHCNDGADFFVKKYLDLLYKQSEEIDTILLACTHYPLLIKKIEEFNSKKAKILSQGSIVARSLKDYLDRHPEIDKICSRNKKIQFFTTDSSENFNEKATVFFEANITSKSIEL